jgi:CheY-like chemotaxis protein/DNA-binding CsgD family transcriptional regulator
MSAEKILVVDDDKTAARVIQLQLRKLGYTGVSLASTGLEAIEKAGTESPDLLIMDIKLGEGIDGIDTAKRIMEQYKVPVIYITAHSDKKILSRALKTSPLGYVNKPIRESDLRTSLALALERIKSSETAQDEKYYPGEGTWQVEFSCDPKGKIIRISGAAKKQIYALGTETLEQILPENHLELVNRSLSMNSPQLLTGKVNDIDYSWQYRTPRRSSNVVVTMTNISVNTASMAESLEKTVLLEMLNRLSTGLILINENLKNYFTNEQADKFLKGNFGLSLQDGFLNCDQPELTAKLQKLVLDATPKTLTLTHEDYDKPLHLLVSPLGSYNQNYGQNLATTILFIFENMGDTKDVESILHDLYNLSPSEAKVAAKLMQKPNLEEVADDLGITYNTARTHLKRIYQKTGTNRLPSLIHLFITGPVGVVIQARN